MDTRPLSLKVHLQIGGRMNGQINCLEEWIVMHDLGG